MSSASRTIWWMYFWVFAANVAWSALSYPLDIENWAWVLVCCVALRGLFCHLKNQPCGRRIYWVVFLMVFVGAGLYFVLRFVYISPPVHGLAWVAFAFGLLFTGPLVWALGKYVFGTATDWRDRHA